MAGLGFPLPSAARDTEKTASAADIGKTCPPDLKSCVNISGTPGHIFYLVNQARFRQWAMRGNPPAFDANTGILYLIKKSDIALRLPARGVFMQPYGVLNQSYWLIPLCGLLKNGLREKRPDWERRQPIVMSPGLVEAAVEPCPQ